MLSWVNDSATMPELLPPTATWVRAGPPADDQVLEATSNTHGPPPELIATRRLPAYTAVAALPIVVQTLGVPVYRMTLAVSGVRPRISDVPDANMAPGPPIVVQTLGVPE